MSVGVTEEVAKELAASTVSDGLKYVFAEADMETYADVSKLQARLTRAADGLKLLLSAWARYEDEQTDSRKRDQVKDARAD
ncbi:MAG: hypothetical protein WCP31_05675 [Chloroflexales bacterium]